MKMKSSNNLERFNMPNNNIIDAITNDNYILKIYQAFNHTKEIVPLVVKLSKTVQSIYRYLEPNHFDGKLIVFATLGNSQILNEADAIKVIDKNILINKSSGIIVMQITSDDRLLLWKDIDITDIYETSDALFYCYENEAEYFCANNNKIDIINHYNCSSRFSIRYHELKEALDNYKIDQILHSSCEILKTCWYDGNRIFFKNGPEETMQKSLIQHLRSGLRGVDAVREYNLGASKPVDIRVYWKEANRAALIELKWLGKTINDDGALSVNYTNSRAIEGIEQLKEYLDLDAQDTPTCITKGYLVVIDGRRKGTNANTTEISCSDGLHYYDKELTVPDDKKYFDTIKNFEKPIRMFAIPICN